MLRWGGFGGWTLGPVAVCHTFHFKIQIFLHILCLVTLQSSEMVSVWTDQLYAYRKVSQKMFKVENFTLLVLLTILMPQSFAMYCRTFVVESLRIQRGSFYCMTTWFKAVLFYLYCIEHWVLQWWGKTSKKWLGDSMICKRTWQTELYCLGVTDFYCTCIGTWHFIFALHSEMNM